MKSLIRLKNLLFIAVSVVCIGTYTYASNVESSSHTDNEFDITEMIMHHIKDAHEIHLWGGEHNGVSIYLPIILIDNGLQTFSSKELYHGVIQTSIDKTTQQPINYIAGVGTAEGYAIFHEKIYKLDNGQLNFDNGHPINVRPIDISITKNVVVLFIVAFLVCWLTMSTARHYTKNGAVAPKGIAKFIEPLVIFVRDDVAKANIGEAKYKKYLPYLLTVFFFILFSNLLGLIPILSANLTGNIAVTLFLAVCTLLLTVLSGNRA